MKSKHISLMVFWIATLHLIFSVPHLFAAPKGPHGIIRVGTFPFEPFNFVDKDGMTQGLNADLLREIVKDEDWSINFIPGSWAEGLERLKNQEIDLLVSVAYSEERGSIMDFTYESVAELWGQVFLRPEGKSLNISDLSGRRVAVMRKDISGINFIKTAEQLGVQCEIVEFATHYDVFAAVKKGDVEAGVAPQHFGLRHVDEYGLVPSSILFSPFSIYFASKKGTQHELLSHIDAHLSEWKKDRNSYFYQRQNYWLANRQSPWELPSWLIYVLVGAASAIVVFASFIYFLNKLVHRKTRELQVSESRHRTILQTAMDGFLLFDNQGQLVEVNQAYCRMSGYSTQELLAMNIADLDTGGPNNNIVNRLEEITRLQADRFETTHRCKNGALINVEISAQYLPMNDGQFVAFVQDITERKMAEQALKESEERLQLVMEGSQLGYWDWNIETGEVRRNKYWAEMLGYTLKEIEESVHQWTDLHHPEDRSAAWQSINDHLEGNTLAHRIEYRMRAKNGQYRWILDQARIVQRNSDGKPIRMSGTHTDITDRKQVEERIRESEARLRESEHHFRTLANSDLALIWTSGTDKLCNYFNETWLRYTGRTLEQELGNGWAEGVHPEDYDRCLNIYVSHFDRREPFSMEYRLCKANGEYGWILDLGNPRYDSEGNFEGYIGYCYDITDRKYAEEEKKILNAQLQQAQKMEAIGTLAGGIAHDFNNILGAILGYTEMAKEDSEPGSTVVKNLDKVTEAGQRASSLVKQILAFSRQSVSEPIPLNPEQIVLEALKLLRPSLPATINITQQFAPSIHTIVADPTQIHQIVMNLCTNAFHAMEEKGGTLTIGLENQELDVQDIHLYPNATPGNYVVLTIGDTGPGIPSDIRDRIFDPFFTTKEVGKGTGMGLAIIHGIATSLGGFVTCNSALGRGTVFSVYFPADQAGIIAPQSTVITDDTPTGKEHVLYVDDEETLAELGKTMLERLGYHVTLCTDSMSALSLFREHPNRFDILVTDQTMPGMTGFELARNILQIQPNFPIILCTGYSNLVDEEDAKQAGIKGFIMKPLTKKGLAELLAKVKSENCT